MTTAADYKALIEVALDAYDSGDTSFARYALKVVEAAGVPTPVTQCALRAMGVKDLLQRFRLRPSTVGKIRREGTARDLRFIALGLMSKEGRLHDEAADLFCDAIGMGDVLAKVLMAEALMKEDDSLHPYAVAFARQAHEAGWHQGTLFLALHDGDRSMLQQAAKKGNAEAMYRLARNAYGNGKRFLLRRAAQMGALKAFPHIDSFRARLRSSFDYVQSGGVDRQTTPRRFIDRPRDPNLTLGREDMSVLIENVISDVDAVYTVLLEMSLFVQLANAGAATLIMYRTFDYALFAEVDIGIARARARARLSIEPKHEALFKVLPIPPRVPRHTFA